MAETLNPLALRQWRAEWQVRAESREERAAGNGMRTFFIFLEPRPRPPQLFRQLSTLNKTNRAASASRSTTPTVPERPGRPPRAKGLPRQPSGPTRCCRKREGFFVFRFFRFSRPLSLFSSASLPLPPPPSLSDIAPLFLSHDALLTSSLPSLQLGALRPLSGELLPRAALALGRGASGARERLAAAAEASAAAAALLEGAAASLEEGVASALPVPVFASLGLPAIAGCFRRAAEPHRKELKRVRRKAVAAADAAVDEWKGTGKKERQSSSAIDRLRSRLTVVISAWKLQALLGPGVAVSGGRASVGSAGAGVAAELACVREEMEGF